MALVNMKDMLSEARKEKRAVGAFNTANYELSRAILQAAEAENQPVIIQLYMRLFDSEKAYDLCGMLQRLATRAKVPVALHLDHGATIKQAKDALAWGYTSVMYDGSRDSFEKNVQDTAFVAQYAHAVGATCEGEIGHVGLAQEGDDRNGQYTTVEEAVDFQTKTGVDALAVAVGNAHGVYKSKPCIQLQRIAELNAAVKCPLVMHGGSGLSDDDFKNAIERGVAKMNIHTDMVCAGMRAMYEQCDAHNRDKIVTWDYLDTRKAKVEAIKKVVLEKMELFGSVGKA